MRIWTFCTQSDIREGLSCTPKALWRLETETVGRKLKNSRLGWVALDLSEPQAGLENRGDSHASALRVWRKPQAAGIGMQYPGQAGMPCGRGPQNVPLGFCSIPWLGLLQLFQVYREHT